MNDLLLLVLTVIGFFALYWALMGQWRHNKMLRDAERIRQEKYGKKEEKK